MNGSKQNNSKQAIEKEIAELNAQLEQAKREGNIGAVSLIQSKLFNAKRRADMMGVSEKENGERPEPKTKVSTQTDKKTGQQRRVIHIDRGDGSGIDLPYNTEFDQAQVEKYKEAIKSGNIEEADKIASMLKNKFALAERGKAAAKQYAEQAVSKVVGGDTIKNAKALKNFKKDPKGAVKAGAMQGLHILFDSLLPGSWEVMQIILKIPGAKALLKGCGLLFLLGICCCCCFMCFMIYSVYKDISEGKLDSIFENGVCVLSNSADKDKFECVMENKMNDYKEGNSPFEV